MIAPQLDSMNDVELRALRDLCDGADLSDLIEIVQSRADDKKTYFILIDGLDECTKENIELVAANIAEISSKGTNRVKVVYAGRPGLEEQLFQRRPAAKYRLPLTKAAVAPDIRTYVELTLDQRLEDEQLEWSDPTLIITIRETLERKADGM